MFVASSILLSRQKTCFVATKIILVAAPANDKETLRGNDKYGRRGEGEEKKESEDREKVQRNGGGGGVDRCRDGGGGIFLWR